VPQPTPQRPAAVFTDLPWLPVGALAEAWLLTKPVPEELATSAFVLAFDADGRLLLSQVRSRGVDITGGHIEPGEGPEAAVRREAWEETGATLRLLGKVGHLRLVVRDPPSGYRYPTPYSFQPFYVAAIEAIGPVGLPDECGDSVLVDPQEAAHDPRFRAHREMILAAAALFDDWRRAGADSPPAASPGSGAETPTLPGGGDASVAAVPQPTPPPLLLRDAAGLAVARKGPYLAGSGIDPRFDWAALKTAEESGEVIRAWLRLTAQSRPTGLDRATLRRELADEIADLFGLACILADEAGIDVEAAFRAKWVEPYA